MRTGFPQNGTQSTARRPESVPSGARVKAVSLVPKVSAMISGYRELAETAVVALMKLGPPRFAEIDGGCFGAGCSLALACDVRVCSPTSQFGIPALKNGLTYEPVFVRRLVEVVGSGPAGLLLYGGERWNGHEAAARGLVDDDVHQNRAAVPSPAM
ncbi:enoyl-CoA hydratase/isomerase family protein [Actinomadura madurae]|uniref:enoyl-CoA hydratase/isomerase family protein n=1 Tax=Actinomadura madurae TaxID=1993 RepID=UPI0020261CDA|nr:enoyl-CoA hydratase/isomerase family protein [Actinomadura madurae]MCP9950996.1 enoyl-CoA hydratase/isomerase family protein [Actinomadura madurae]MCP9980232.1 enoyl-CoA hydratase/isomerase family protein [Actinomadura madurae]MCQ0008244.1 enoyl-CoA hydratase/isomerase family protein [Actinomadura madurae]MCQ0016441.1 enoyl-CoA hydratase/isomerase family protein [Actinomadura madurae]URM96542.1 enoyl-CoA hydratase/isomerase family protein [Actinomadura madurae]